LASPLAAEQPKCGTRDEIVAVLSTKYGETRQAMGIGGGPHLFEVFASEETGSWTITATSLQGVMCVIAAGGDFELLNEPSGEPA